MKTPLLLLCGLLATARVLGQCDAPIVTSWQATDPSNITIDFEPPEGALTYTLSVYSEYGNSDGFDFSPLVIDSAVVAGENTVSFDMTPLVSSSYIQRVYFSVELSVTCANGESSAINRFYVSPHSMLNDPAVNVGEFFQPMTFLPDGSGFSYDSYIAIPEGETPVEIEDLAVFIDVGHTYVGDLSIELISPQGTTTTLLPHPNDFVSTFGLSFMFQDSATPVLEMSDTYGFCSPADSLSIYQGTNPAGVWVVRITDHYGIDDGMLFGMGFVINSSPCDAYLAGTVFYDGNGNGFQDPEEPGMVMPKIANDLDGSITTGGYFGQYVECTTPGAGTLSLVNPPMYHTAPDHTFSLDSGDATWGLNFPLTTIPGMDDLFVTIFNSVPNRPGFESNYVIQYGNQGTECIQDVDITAVFEPYMTLLEVSGDSVVIDGEEAVIHFDELCPQENGMLYVTILTDDTVTIGSMSTATATITPLDQDQTPDDNVSVSSTMMMGSFDPNDKTVGVEAISPMFLSEQLPLKYMVRFQNTGNYYAERVLIVDTLDEALDPESLTLTAHSHPVEVTHNQNVYYFEFDDIYLPDSTTDEAGSHGFLRYDVTPYPGLADGTTIENTASIFFDFNPPIHTNTVISTVDYSLGLGDIRINAAVHPNPATDDIEIVLPEGFRISDVSIFGVSGRLVARITGSGAPTMRLPVADLKPGTYLLQINGGESIRPLLFVKQRE